MAETVEAVFYSINIQYSAISPRRVMPFGATLNDVEHIQEV
jgi:hypothetical protein